MALKGPGAPLAVAVAVAVAVWQNTFGALLYGNAEDCSPCSGKDSNLRYVSGELVGTNASRFPTKPPAHPLPPLCVLHTDTLCGFYATHI